MQLREEIKSYGTKECPVNDWMCRYFDNGVCKLRNAEEVCDHMRENNGIDKEDKRYLSRTVL